MSIKDNDKEDYFHKHIRETNEGFELLADYYEDNNYPDINIIKYLRMMPILLNMKGTDSLNKIVLEMWDLIKNNEKFFLMGVSINIYDQMLSHDQALEPYNYDFYFLFNIGDNYFYASDRMIYGIRAYNTIKLITVEHQNLFTLNKFTLLKRFIILNKIWHRGYQENKDG